MDDFLKHKLQWHSLIDGYIMPTPCATSSPNKNTKEVNQVEPPCGNTLLPGQLSGIVTDAQKLHKMYKDNFANFVSSILELLNHEMT